MLFTAARTWNPQTHRMRPLCVLVLMPVVYTLTVRLRADRSYQCMLAVFLTVWFSSQMSDEDGDYDLPPCCIPQVAPPPSSSTSFAYNPAEHSLCSPEGSDDDDTGRVPDDEEGGFGASQPHTAAEPPEPASRDAV